MFRRLELIKALPLSLLIAYSHGIANKSVTEIEAESYVAQRLQDNGIHVFKNRQLNLQNDTLAVQMESDLYIEVPSPYSVLFDIDMTDSALIYLNGSTTRTYQTSPLSISALESFIDKRRIIVSDGTNLDAVIDRIIQTVPAKQQNWGDIKEKYQE